MYAVERSGGKATNLEGGNGPFRRVCRVMCSHRYADGIIIAFVITGERSEMVTSQLSRRTEEGGGGKFQHEIKKEPGAHAD